jgi:hypothetical protein
MSDSDVSQMEEMMSREMTEDDYLNLLRERLEREINKTPTGDLRNLLTELNIVFQTKMYKLNPSDEWYKKASEEEDKFDGVGTGII